MPPAFTEDERERIGGLLRAAGQRLFATQGLRKTSLDELVGPAGIAKSSFYAFYDSKEELYIDLMFRQVPQLKKQLFDRLFDESVDTRDALRGFMYGVLDIQQNNPLYRRLMTHPDELAAVSRKTSDERLAEAQDFVVSPVLEFMKRAQRDVAMPDVDPAVLLGVIQAVMVVPLEKERFDPDVYPKALELLIDLVATGLTTPGRDDQPGEER